MGKLQNNQSGFSAVEAILVLVIVVAIAGVGWFVWHSKQSADKTLTTNSSTTPTFKKQTKAAATQTTDPYAGWKTATSTRAGFTVKYPTNWTYTAAVGDNDNVEHITIDSSHFHITIDSFMGNNGGTDATGATANATCVDCISTLASKSTSISNLGKINVETVTVKLDSGKGNAIILRMPDSTYGILSPRASNVYTNFRGISVLDSLQAYQSETATQFGANPDLATAKLIFQSISY